MPFLFINARMPGIFKIFPVTLAEIYQTVSSHCQSSVEAVIIKISWKNTVSCTIIFLNIAIGSFNSFANILRTGCKWKHKHRNKNNTDPSIEALQTSELLCLKELNIN